MALVDRVRAGDVRSVARLITLLENHEPEGLAMLRLLAPVPHNAAVIGITNDETGISEDPDVRFELARKSIHRAADYGIPPQDVLIDPLAMPVDSCSCL